MAKERVLQIIPAVYKAACRISDPVRRLAIYETIFHYQLTGEEYDGDDENLAFAFEMAKDKWLVYLEACRARAENGAKGGKAKAENQKLANASNSYQSVANASKSKQSLPHIISSQVISNQINSDQGGETGVQGEKPTDELLQDLCIFFGQEPTNSIRWKLQRWQEDGVLDKLEYAFDTLRIKGNPGGVTLIDFLDGAWQDIRG